MPENKISGSLIIGCDINRSTDIAVLIVGVKRPNETVKIINAFQGDEAEELYKKLTTTERNVTYDSKRIPGTCPEN